MLKLGRDAEHLAKRGYDSQKERNALAVTVRARSNSEISVREQWGAQKLAAGGELAELSIEQRLLFWADHFAKGHIPTKFPYELRGAAKFYENWKENTDEAMRMDAIRIFNRKELKLGNDKGRVEDYINDVIKGSYKAIERLGDELLTAQWIGYSESKRGSFFKNYIAVFRRATKRRPKIIRHYRAEREEIFIVSLMQCFSRRRIAQARGKRRKKQVSVRQRYISVIKSFAVKQG
ncbi:hypothetical protein FACS1894187_25580 [Synergistales bacterium]|nr:hypothetical protein FACS1894187_25580 [Synergistales bacterium]